MTAGSVFSMHDFSLGGRLVDEDGFCHVCGNNGFLDKVCPSCGRAPKKSSFLLEERNDGNDFAKRMKQFGVPDCYRGIAWDADTLKKYNSGRMGDRNFLRYVENLDKINRVFCMGNIPSKSAMIISPPGLSKTVFMYSCIQRAVDNGFTVAPVLNTLQLKRLLVLAADNPKYKPGGVDYDEYIAADVCFLVVTDLPQHAYASTVILELIHTRARMNLGTIVLSHYKLSELHRFDSTNQFDVLKQRPAFDTFGYPTIIAYDPI